LLWESGAVANTAAGAFLTIPISSGTPSALTLPPGTYQLAWQVDSGADVPSYTAGVAGDGLYVAQPFGPAPAQLNPLTPTTTDEKWSMYITYDAPTPTESPTPSPNPTLPPSPTPNVARSWDIYE